MVNHTRTKTTRRVCGGLRVVLGSVSGTAELSRNKPPANGRQVVLPGNGRQVVLGPFAWPSRHIYCSAHRFAARGILHADGVTHRRQHGHHGYRVGHVNINTGDRVAHKTRPDIAGTVRHVRQMGPGGVNTRIFIDGIRGWWNSKDFDRIIRGVDKPRYILATDANGLRGILDTQATDPTYVFAAGAELVDRCNEEPGWFNNYSRMAYNAPAPTSPDAAAAVSADEPDIADPDAGWWDVDPVEMIAPETSEWVNMLGLVVRVQVRRRA